MTYCVYCNDTLYVLFCSSQSNADPSRNEVIKQLVSLTDSQLFITECMYKKVYELCFYSSDLFCILSCKGIGQIIDLLEYMIQLVNLKGIIPGTGCKMFLGFGIQLDEEDVKKTNTAIVL